MESLSVWYLRTYSISLYQKSHLLAALIHSISNTTNLCVNTI